MGDIKKTKIIYAITKSAYGGAGKYLLELSTFLPKERFDVEVVLGGHGPLAKMLETEGIKTISMPSLERDIKIFNDFSAFRELYKIFQEEKPDIVHLNSSKIGGIGALAGRLSRVPKIIFTAHGWPFNENRNFLSKVAIYIASWITVALSTATIVIDEHDMAQAKKFPFCSKKIKLIHNGIKPFPLIDRKESRIILSKIIGKNPFEDKITVGTIAELTKNKGLKYGIEAISKLPQEILKKVIYIIIGEGEERGELSKLIEQKGLKGKVFLLGFLDDAKKYLLAFDIFMLPSLKEGLPYVLLEAGFAGLPLITTKVGGIPNIIGDNKSDFLVESKKSEALSRALKEIIENRKIRTTLSKKIRENVIRKFNFEKMAEKTIKIYENSL